MTPALAGGFFTTEPPGKPQDTLALCLSMDVMTLGEFLNPSVPLCLYNRDVEGQMGEYRNRTLDGGQQSKCCASDTPPP